MQMVANIILFQVQDSQFVIQYMSMHILQTFFLFQVQYSKSLVILVSNVKLTM